MVQIIGHRGALALVPENTIESFKRAIEAGVDYIECDVHLSRDSRLAVIHDAKLDRTTDGVGNVRDFTLTELKALRIAGGLRIPTIEEVLELNFPLMIELKSYREGDSTRLYEGLPFKLLQLLRDTKPQQEIILSSTNREYAEELSGAPFKRLNLLPGFSGLSSLGSSDLYAVGVFYRDLTAELLEEAHAKRLKVFSWPPDQTEEIERSIQLGLDLLLSNNPAHAVEIARQFRPTA